MKKVCERSLHQRLGWGFTATGLLGVGLGAWMMGGLELAVIIGLLAAFSAAVYVGVVKLEAPKSKRSTEPTPPTPTGDTKQSP